ncbi:putative iron-regulated protein [Halopseudomonas xinjiangensis]|uniref:Putative iron-regulated protein n=1 Tax=Halopseudomonas xinjiangensis TaxID=487184 RepID=A0A1H1QZN9_9GAMM|nr:imelysin family protein [Halopseudomonas xinjiangensis]SDS28882.1 putative iron-regulated protein [Halopseudomonas xinjiangensis]
MVVRFPLKSLAVVVSASWLLVACDRPEDTPPEPQVSQVEADATVSADPATSAESGVNREAVVETYADIAYATYQDALTTAQRLDKAVDELIANPNQETLQAAREAWKQARVPYQQSEVFRFGNPVVDEWEGQLNAWPLDEGLIDYVANDGYEHEMGNDGANANIIASQEINIGGTTHDVSELTPELLAELNEVGGSEANVATGYHAIEFLLWGQDRNGFERGNGDRPATDYAKGDECTNGNCDRRAEYIDAATDLLVQDLEWMVQQWAPGKNENYRAELLELKPEEAHQRMLFGMGSLSLGELAGERMKVALEANSYEDEHDCFSDNTHNSHYYNGLGIQNVYLGRYERVDGEVVEGASLSDLVAQTDTELDHKLRLELEQSMQALGEMKKAAEAESEPMPFDMMIAPENERGHELINNAINALVEQTGSIEAVAAKVGVESLEPDDAGHSF